MDRIDHAYVIVAGEPSDEADEGIAGFYRVDFKDGAPVDLLEEIALEAFYDSHGIEVLDDFDISVVGPDGNQIEGQREPKGERLLEWSAGCEGGDVPETFAEGAPGAAALESFLTDAPDVPRP